MTPEACNHERDRSSYRIPGYALFKSTTQEPTCYMVVISGHIFDPGSYRLADAAAFTAGLWKFTNRRVY